MDIGPGLAPGTTASGLMTKSLVPGGSRPGTDMAPRGCFRRLGCLIGPGPGECPGPISSTWLLPGGLGGLIGPGPGECPGPMSPEGFRVLGFLCFIFTPPFGFRF